MIVKAYALAIGALLPALAGCVTLNVPRTGEMVTTLGEGDVYRGTYGPARRAAPDVSAVAVPSSAAFSARTRRHAIQAELIGSQGWIRCWFGLGRPAIGVLGGGRGQCRLPDGSAVDSHFPPSVDWEQVPFSPP